ncbi:MAG: flagellar assembly lytic transglycosylase [Spirochaetales bacterium]
MRCTHLLLPLFLSFSACANEAEPHFLGMDYEASIARVEQGDYSFLSDFDDAESQPVYGIEEGAAYYIGRIFEEMGRSETAVQFYSRQWDEEVEPWRSEAGRRLVLLVGNEVDVGPHADRALAVAETLSGELAGDSRPAHLPEVAFDRGELLLARADLLLELERYEELSALASETDTAPSLYPRLAVAALELGRPPEAREYLRRTLERSPRGDALVTLSKELESGEAAESGDGDEEEDSDARFDSTRLDLLSARAAVADRDWEQAVEAFGADDAKEFARGLPEDLRTARPVAGDIREAFFRAGRPRDGAAVLQAIADEVDEQADGEGAEEALTYIYQSAGRLYRNAGAHREAVDALGRAIDTASDPEDRDAALYHYLHAAVSANPQSLVERLEDRLEGSVNTSRFDRPLERLLANIIPSRRWDLLAEAYPAVRAHASGRSAAQYGVTYAAALRAGLAPPPTDVEWPELGPAEPAAGAGPARSAGRRLAGDEDAEAAEEALLEQAAGQSESRYYAILASVMQGEQPGALPGERDVERSVVPGPDDELISGYLEYGLLGPAYEAVYGEGRRSGESVTRELAERLAADGKLLESLRVANRLSRIDGVVIDTELAELIYPRAYEEQLLSVTEDYEIPEYLFYGLVREESYFDASIQSWVGATGLAQLMPSTAADVAARLGVGEYDLTDPETNLRFGGRYFSDLYGTFGEWTPSLIAYNAGQGRVRRWLALRGDLPPLLFHESVPLQESRDYIRKVLISAVNYRHLYEGGNVEATVEDFFPGVSGGTNGE